MMNETIDRAIRELDDARKRIDELEKMTCDKPLDHPDWNAVHDIRWYYDGLKDMLDTIVSYEFGLEYCVATMEDGHHEIVSLKEFE